MRATVRTTTLAGVEAVSVEVEADIARGVPSFTVVGMADTAVQEARERVRSAIRASGFDFPAGRVVLNLAPAPLPKRGTGFDLPMAASILVATGQIDQRPVQDATLVGELSLTGAVRPVAGLLAHASAAIRDGRLLLGPVEGSAGAHMVAGGSYRPLAHLKELAAVPGTSVPPTQCSVTPERVSPDLSDVHGHALPKRALEISAAGGHNLLMTGPPGSGKTMLARCLCGILPPMGPEERLATALIHSVAGLDDASVLAGQRPFRAPHHSCSAAGLLGGGRHAGPGEACLAHNGVLFLDEMTEFAPSVLQGLRQPLEDGRLRLVRAECSATYPARFTLVGALNPCPCGFHGDSSGRCSCPPSLISRHETRIGGPLLDRMDLFLRVDRVSPENLLTGAGEETSADVAARVCRARSRSEGRPGPPHTRLSGRELLAACLPTPEALAVLTRAGNGRALSGRAITHVLRVSRSIADLDGHDSVTAEHVLEALALRGGECIG